MKDEIALKSLMLSPDLALNAIWHARLPRGGHRLPELRRQTRHELADRSGDVLLLGAPAGLAHPDFPLPELGTLWIVERDAGALRRTYDHSAIRALVRKGRIGFLAGYSPGGVERFLNALVFSHHRGPITVLARDARPHADYLRIANYVEKLNRSDGPGKRFFDGRRVKTLFLQGACDAIRLVRRHLNDVLRAEGMNHVVLSVGDEWTQWRIHLHSLQRQALEWTLAGQALPTGVLPYLGTFEEIESEPPLKSILPFFTHLPSRRPDLVLLSTIPYLTPQPVYRHRRHGYLFQPYNPSRGMVTSAGFRRHFALESSQDLATLTDNLVRIIELIRSASHARIMLMNQSQFSPVAAGPLAIAGSPLRRAAEINLKVWDAAQRSGAWLLDVNTFIATHGIRHCLLDWHHLRDEDWYRMVTRQFVEYLRQAGEWD
jgi:hypothetical protein